MISLAYILVFVFCAAIAAACLLISHQFITTYNSDFHRNYYYYLATFFAFAFYGIWGQLIAWTFLSALDFKTEVIEAIAGFLPILGMPFLFISWIMLIKTAYSLFERQMPARWLIIHGVLLLILISGIWIVFDYTEAHQLLKDGQLKAVELFVMLFIEAIYFLEFTRIVLWNLKKHQKSSKNYLHRFIILMLVGMILREALLSALLGNPWIGAFAILLFFLSNFIPVFYLNTIADQLFDPLFADQTDNEKMERLILKYKISRRERDIVILICAGKTNQQIADTLFISLQTVKDHTHRIYSKIGINSRMKLVHLVNK